MLLPHSLLLPTLSFALSLALSLALRPLSGTFNFMLIAFTQSKVIIPKKAVGETVNLEVDVISKYVEQSLAAVVERVATLEAKLEVLAAK